MVRCCQIPRCKKSSFQETKKRYLPPKKNSNNNNNKQPQPQAAQTVRCFSQTTGTKVTFYFLHCVGLGLACNHRARGPVSSSRPQASSSVSSLRRPRASHYPRVSPHLLHRPRGLLARLRQRCCLSPCRDEVDKAPLLVPRDTADPGGLAEGRVKPLRRRHCSSQL